MNRSTISGGAPLRTAHISGTQAAQALVVMDARHSEHDWHNLRRHAPGRATLDAVADCARSDC